jgi:hypothetical protein
MKKFISQNAVVTTQASAEPFSRKNILLSERLPPKPFNLA